MVFAIETKLNTCMHALYEIENKLYMHALCEIEKNYLHALCEIEKKLYTCMLCEFERKIAQVQFAFRNKCLIKQDLVSY